MVIPASALVRAAVAALADERSRKAVGWILLAALSPVILLIAAFCSILGGLAAHNNSVLDLCFSGGTPPPDMPAE